MKTWNLDVKSLFDSVGIKKKGLVILNENAYDFNPENPGDSWLYPAFLGFNELKKSGFKPESFATIGTGAGVDSIGVFEIFHPKRIYQIDIHPNVPKIAQENAQQWVSSKAIVETFLGDLCEPLIKKKIKVDLVYANIPNIPTSKKPLDKKVSASQFLAREYPDVPTVFQKWYLTHQYLFLKQAKNVVTEKGVVVDAIGIRVPYKHVLELFTENGYDVEELVSIYKIQSEPEDTLEGYAKHEKEAGVEFDFYDHEKAGIYWQKNLKGKRLATPELKEALKQFRISATEAFKNWQKSGKQAGHICSILKGTL
jgi:methylase of polypeptide subunit release factors